MVGLAVTVLLQVAVEFVAKEYHGRQEGDNANTDPPIAETPVEQKDRLCPPLHAAWVQPDSSRVHEG